MKLAVIHNIDYIVYIEEYLGFSFIHCDCTKWTKTIKTNLSEDFEKLRQIHRKDIYAIHDIADQKHLKFLTIMGFKFNKCFIGSDNKERQLFVRSYDGN
jgi:hypothetical protein